MTSRLVTFTLLALSVARNVQSLSIERRDGTSIGGVVSGVVNGVVGAVGGLVGDLTAGVIDTAAIAGDLADFRAHNPGPLGPQADLKIVNADVTPDGFTRKFVISSHFMMCWC